ncbi:MAG: YtxH domain-containing protein [Bacillota bacterium]
MRNRFLTGVVAGGLLGASAGMYAYSRMSPRQRRKMMRRGSKLVRNAVNMMDIMQDMDIMK